ncbi:MAG: rhomboid family intramembrane serine protease [Chloroflexi bacterium]|nr:rhomboid family intramembrane serine protease [Ardenticatenaceae bacterium]MBL1131617.1 rhomboid family intramembrane serine protease [Chloroflexota bacterium]NOG37732.1 rhomboid family intramembrane serine protease [Chloroflexota bacterium]GIK58214.1 MAG: rhomboid family intramembrane serine protease [Chloroflexota bacterium]
MDANALLQLFRNLPEGLQIVLGLYGIMLVIRLIDWIIFRDGMINRFGLRGMRAPKGNHFLAWILNPFIHLNWRHLWSNSVGWLPMATIIALLDTQEFLLATAVIIIIGNLGLWLFEKGNVVTAGASGMITGYFGFLLLRGFFTRDTTAVIIGFVMLAVYYSLLRLIFIPQKGNVSNVGHFFGFLGGVAAAWLWSFILPQPFQ